MWGGTTRVVCSKDMLAISSGSLNEAELPVGAKDIGQGHWTSGPSDEVFTIVVIVARRPRSRPTTKGKTRKSTRMSGCFNIYSRIRDIANYFELSLNEWLISQIQFVISQIQLMVSLLWWFRYISNSIFYITNRISHISSSNDLDKYLIHLEISPNN